MVSQAHCMFFRHYFLKTNYHLTHFQFVSKDPNKKSQLALRLLGPWQERFAVGQEEAIATYNEPFSNKNRPDGLTWISWIFGWLTPRADT